MREKIVEKIYKLALKYIQCKMGNKETASDQLDIIGKKLFGEKFHGVYPSDQIPKLSKQTPYAILNLDTSNQFGSHWISVVFDNDDLLVNDSFGRKSVNIIPVMHKGGRDVLDADLDAEQKMREENCGQRSLAAIFVYDQFGKTAYMAL